MISPESPPPWASRMSAMTARKPMGITSQAKSGMRSHGTRKAAVRIPMKTTAAIRTSRREPRGERDEGDEHDGHGLEGEERESGPHGAVEAGDEPVPLHLGLDRRVRRGRE